MRVPNIYLTKREQEIMEFLFQSGEATANQVMEKLSGNLSNSSVRTHLRILEEKGVITHQVVEGKFIYSPVDKREAAAESALASVIKTFFRGSISQAVASMISGNESKLSQQELEEIEQLIAKAKEEGR